VFKALALGASSVGIGPPQACNGARMLGPEQEFGSLIPGKSADFIIIGQDIFKLVAASHAQAVGDIQVLETWFQGRRVYAAATSANATP